MIATCVAGQGKDHRLRRRSVPRVASSDVPFDEYATSSTHTVKCRLTDSTTPQVRPFQPYAGGGDSRLVPGMLTQAAPMALGKRVSKSSTLAHVGVTAIRHIRESLGNRSIQA